MVPIEIQQIAYYQDVLHRIHEGNGWGSALPQLPNPEKLGAAPTDSALQLAYVKYLVAEQLILHDLNDSMSRDDYLAYMDGIARLGEYLLWKEMIPRSPAVR